MSQKETNDREFILQVIGSGFARTGTQSLREALKFLGLSPCYHMFSFLSLCIPYRTHMKVPFCEKTRKVLIYNDPKDDKKRVWNNIARVPPKERSEINWDKVFEKDNFQAGVDFPVAFFYKEIYEFYKKKQRKMGSKKGIKVILTVRDPHKWYKSGKSHVFF